MLFAQHPLLCHQGAAIKRFGLIIAGLGTIQSRQIANGCER